MSGARVPWWRRLWRFAPVRFELLVTEALPPGRYPVEWAATHDTQDGRVAHLKIIRKP